MRSLPRPRLIVFSLLVALLAAVAVTTVARSGRVPAPEGVAAVSPPIEGPAAVSRPVTGVTRPGAEPAPEDVIERFKLAKGGTLLLVPVELWGKTFLFALDTGASCGVYDASLAPFLGEPISVQEVRTSDGIVRASCFPSPDAKLGRMSLRTDSPVITADLCRMREALGEEVYGCIGMDVLAKHVFRVDPDRGEIVFLRSPGADPGRLLPTTIENQTPSVRVLLSGLTEPQSFLVDTGCSPGGGTGLVTSETFDALTQRDKIRPIDTVLAGSLSGRSLRRRGRVVETELAGHRHADLIFSAAQRNVLGVGYWSRYVTTFDFAAGAIYLKKSSRFEQPDTHDLSGLTFVRVGGRTLVVAVEEGSPAARAGILPTDRILKVMDNTVEDVALATARRLLAVRGARVSLLVERGGEARDVSFVLSD